ncbi:bacillithiol biosynthesis cysteine-adding enzyme BshC [Bacillus sp. FJAT-45037]|uniref:bacillithiol biosynthesis cysteine-adding enzyme BshC n=1 Tax=Bacillus sp. FJAT-45037 TaxID=2011007 RepID=UPI0012FD2E86|nr:bacillithiol biosynthesis cysteine-adding enzyme BshC [Bacillus sp. FJAT-45037]
MEVKEMDLVKKPDFLSDYLVGHPNTLACFDYDLTDETRYKQRVSELQSRSFPREELIKHLHNTHNDLPNTEAVQNNIDKLQDTQSVVVVGGQQAGLLTGPLYTVYKAMSVVLLAKEQEEQLGIPVVPVFWVAGEDHDLEEVRFVYTKKGKTWKKKGIDMIDSSTSLSKTLLPKATFDLWLDDVFKTLPETDHTESLVTSIKELATQSETFVDFFSRVMNWIFKDEGLILLDSDHPNLRKIEREYFKKMIEQVDRLQSAQQQGEDFFKQLGYGEPIATDLNNAHLFYTLNGNRKRLDYSEGIFTIKGEGIRFSKKELLELVDVHPERFSNNVVTRPLMQELLLPVLTFVAGPGELAYWATLKPVFKLFDLHIPPLSPRIHLTVVPRSLAKWFNEHECSYERFMRGEGSSMKGSWLNEAEDYPIHEVMAQVKQSIAVSHLDIQQLAQSMDPTIYTLAKKNETKIFDQLEFMEKKMVNYLKEKHEVTLSKFDEADAWLFPLSRPQERVVHPILLLNIAGPDAFRRMMNLDMSLDARHKLVFL